MTGSDFFVFTEHHSLFAATHMNRPHVPNHLGRCYILHVASPATVVTFPSVFDSGRPSFGDFRFREAFPHSPTL